jgi:hypothetical protein
VVYKSYYAQNPFAHMDNDEIEKYKREVEQNQMREQGLFKKKTISFIYRKYFLNSAFKKNSLLDDIRKGIFLKKYILLITYHYYCSLGGKKLQTKSTNFAKEGVRIYIF